MKRFFLAAGLIATLVPAALAQETKPAVQASELSAREQATLGTYKADSDAAPVITLKASGKQLIMSATGFPDIPVTLTEKDELTSTLLPAGAGYTFTLLRDKDKKVIGLKVETPMGGGEFKRVAEATPAAPAKKDSIPDILGKYESEQEFEGMILKSEVSYEKGKLILRSEGQPDYTLTLNKDDTLSAEPAFPEGLTVKLIRNKEGKVTGSQVGIGDNKLNFIRKTFPPVPGAETKPEAKGELPDVLGKYEPEDPSASPVGPGEVVVREGKLVLLIDGQPDYKLTVDKDLKISADFPEGISAKFVADKDGKITKIVASTPAGDIVFLRKTFVKQGATASPLARLQALEGTYTSETPGLPVVKMSVREGKLVIEPEGADPVLDAKLSEKDELTGEGLPEGFTVFIQRDKDGKVTGMLVKTPMGDFVFTRKPAA